MRAIFLRHLDLIDVARAVLMTGRSKVPLSEVRAALRNYNDGLYRQVPAETLRREFAYLFPVYKNRHRHCKRLKVNWPAVARVEAFADVHLRPREMVSPSDYGLGPVKLRGGKSPRRHATSRSLVDA